MVRVLIVDDASFMRGSLKYILELNGHTVVGMAKNGMEAVRMYEELKPDLVTMDILMEVMDGITALKAIMENDANAKVIMVTAMGLEEGESLAKELGALGYIRSILFKLSGRPFAFNSMHFFL